MNQIFLFLSATILFAACNTSNPNNATVAPVEKKSFSQQVSDAHKKNDFKQKDAISFHVSLSFGGSERLNAQMTLTTDDSKLRIDKKDGTQIIVKGDTVFHNSDANPASVRFSAYTWSYFFMLPFKLNDPGTIWSDYPNNNLNGTSYSAEKLSFTKGTGDAPDDWYIVYADTTTHLINTAAYIVTGGNTSQAEAEEDPHAIKYEAYQMIQGVPMATKWSFWAWNADSGLTKQLGHAELTQVAFSSPKEDFFSTSSDFKTVL